MKATQISFKNLVRNSTLALLASILMACQGETSAQTPAATATVEEGTYSAVKSESTVSTGDKIEVVELFWFGCNHCFALEPKIKTWLKNKPENAEFVKVPALFSKRWEFHGQAYYTMEALGVPQEAYDAFFRRIHVERKNINSLAQLTSFLESYGKSAEEVESTFNSFAVDSKMRNAKKITLASGATGVPAMVIDGKYLTSQQQAGGTEELFKVIDQLVEKAAAER